MVASWTIGSLSFWVIRSMTCGDLLSRWISHPLGRPISHSLYLVISSYLANYSSRYYCGFAIFYLILLIFSIFCRAHYLCKASTLSHFSRLLYPFNSWYLVFFPFEILYSILSILSSTAKAKFMHYFEK
jgi:hypothetical protein